MRNAYLSKYLFQSVKLFADFTQLPAGGALFKLWAFRTPMVGRQVRLFICRFNNMKKDDCCCF